MIDFEKLKLGVNSRLIILESQSDHQLASLSLIAQAKRQLLLLSDQLDPKIYDSAAMVQTIAKLCRTKPQIKIQIIIQDSNNIIQHGHRLVELARRLTSFINIRILPSSIPESVDNFLIVDGTGILLRQDRNRYDGIVNFNAPNEAREKAKYFTELFEQSTPDPKLRRLSI